MRVTPTIINRTPTDTHNRIASPTSFSFSFSATASISGRIGFTSTRFSSSTALSPPSYSRYYFVVAQSPSCRKWVSMTFAISPFSSSN